MNILKSILYFSIFNYPLSPEEVFRFSDSKEKEETMKTILSLEQRGIIYNNKGYYSVLNDKNILTRRLEGNKNAENIMPKAWKIAKFISNFPYIDSVCISGSLSKGYFDENSDIDFFIITRENRIWIARTLLILYKKIFLLNSKKYFCVNYFMSSDYLNVNEKNRFTATEIATLIPLYGETIFQKFLKENKWVYEFFPNLIRKEKNIKKISKSTFTKMVEKLLNYKIGDYIEKVFMKITIKKWRDKFNHLPKEDFEIAFKSSENVSKHHPSNFQKKVLSLLNERYEEMEKIHNIKLAQEHA
jgi:predicted nucleotidyltransferase